MKVFAFVLLVLGVAMVSAAPQDINSAILAVINSAVPNVQPGSFARPPPGGVSSFATAQQNTNPSGQTFFAAQTGVSQGRPVRK
ncbi:uncharacterized protein LOC116929029 [Daphnia magna]|uniref:Uncharacterized protein n=3 Tax=Daphnia TaxID=6668 RepID=A0A164W191_9CRUS|nr:uncharacterized protein LOC116929029 [Daphnia magna]KAI9551559.1 hypothetical protein GHT06_021892 [Daphnia sinensis]KAK4035475.1 hypothetical protein OUZ56_027563 [Daphnia magna]KZS12856.1 Uncharacterized protein APZ42_022093 [Daphnia magna]